MSLSAMGSIAFSELTPPKIEQANHSQFWGSGRKLDTCYISAAKCIPRGLRAEGGVMDQTGHCRSAPRATRWRCYFKDPRSRWRLIQYLFLASNLFISRLF